MLHMWRLSFCIIWANLLSIAQTQIQRFKVKPEKCYGTFEVMDRRCCIFPPFFNRQVARECGAIFAVLSIDKEHDVTNMQRVIYDVCDHWRCILNKYSILNADDIVNNEKYFDHLDKWVALNPDFNNAMTTAKAYCRERYRLDSPITVCNFFDYQTCIRRNIMLNCPKVIQTQECLEWKEFYDECKEYFV